MNKQSIQHGKYILCESPVNAVQEMDRQQNTLEVVTNARRCPSCKSAETIFDGITGEIICTTCGTVVLDRQETPASDINAKNRSGMPSSLVFPDKGLSTIITYSNTDANGHCPKSRTDYNK